jgi:hypothetical protein
MFPSRDELVASGNLQTLLLAIVQRLDRHEQAISGKAAGNTESDSLVVIEKTTYDKMLNRIEVVENTQLQAKLSSMGQEKDLSQLTAERQSHFKLAQHVIPLASVRSPPPE